MPSEQLIGTDFQFRYTVFSLVGGKCNDKFFVSLFLGRSVAQDER